MYFLVLQVDGLITGGGGVELTLDMYKRSLQNLHIVTLEENIIFMEQATFFMLWVQSAKILWSDAAAALNHQFVEKLRSQWVNG